MKTNKKLRRYKIYIYIISSDFHILSQRSLALTYPWGMGHGSGPRKTREKRVRFFRKNWGFMWVTEAAAETVTRKPQERSGWIQIVGRTSTKKRSRPTAKWYQQIWRTHSHTEHGEDQTHGHGLEASVGPWLPEAYSDSVGYVDYRLRLTCNDGIC